MCPAECVARDDKRDRRNAGGEQRVRELCERMIDRAAAAAVGGQHRGIAVEAGVAAEGAGGYQGPDHQREIGVHGLGQRDDDGHGHHDGDGAHG